VTVCALNLHLWSGVDRNLGFTVPGRWDPSSKGGAAAVTHAQPALVTASGFNFLDTGFANLGVALALCDAVKPLVANRL